MIERKRDHVRMLLQQRVDSATEIADSFPVNDPHLKNAAFLTGVEIIENELLHFARLERVQVQHPVDRKFYGLIHDLRISQGARLTKAIRCRWPVELALRAGCKRLEFFIEQV